MNKFQAAFNESLTKEELKGKQKKLDVAAPYGKLTGADFAKLRKAKSKELDNEGNAFTAGLAKTSKGEKFKLGNKEITDTSNYDAKIDERHMTSPEKKKASVLHKKLPTSAFTKQYGKKEGEKIKYATATKMAMHKEHTGIELEARPGSRTQPQPSVNEPSDAEAWQKSLDKDTDPASFDGAVNPSLKLDTEGVAKAKEWITRLEDMATFINGMEEKSLNAQINALEMRNSIPFKGIVRREEKRITKLAENLRGLAELFKTVVTGSGKKIHDATSRGSR